MVLIGFSFQVQNFGVPRQRRTELPTKMVPAESLGMGAMAKMVFGMSGLPISYFEPISMIQAVCEELRYVDLLTRAAQMIDPIDRMVCFS